MKTIDIPVESPLLLSGLSESVVVVVGMQRWRAVLLDPHALGLSLDQLILLLHV